MHGLYANILDKPRKEESFEPLVRGNDGLLVERIVSWGQASPEAFWYDQPTDEWVAVLEGSACLLFEDGHEHRLEKGDHLLIPRHVRHKVTFTSSPCIWLAIHGTGLVAAG